MANPYSRLWLLLPATFAVACGQAPASAPETTPAKSAALTARPGPASAARAIGQLEMAAIELSKLALHRAHHPDVWPRAHATLEAHRTLLHQWNCLVRRNNLPVATGMDGFGQSLWSSLQQEKSRLFAASWCSSGRALQAHAIQILQQSGAYLYNSDLQAHIATLTEAWAHLPMAAEP